MSRRQRLDTFSWLTTETSFVQRGKQSFCGVVFSEFGFGWEVRERTNRSIYSDKKGKTWDRSVTSKVFLVSKFFQNRSDDRVLKTIGNLLTESDRLVIFKSDIVYWEQLGKVRRSHLAITETRKKARSLRQGEKLGSSSHYLLGNEFERSDTSASEAGWGNWELWPDTGEIRFGGRSESVLKEC